VRLLSRTAHELGRSYPEVVEGIAAQRCSDFAVDGEIVAFQGRLTSFARLQGRMQLTDPDAARRTGIEVFLYVFDIVHLAGHDLRQLPLRTRKAAQAHAVVRGPDPLRHVGKRAGSAAAQGGLRRCAAVRARPRRCDGGSRSARVRRQSEADRAGCDPASLAGAFRLIAALNELLAESGGG
jgi:hypothetical protein